MLGLMLLGRLHRAGSRLRGAKLELTWLLDWRGCHIVSGGRTSATLPSLPGRHRCSLTPTTKIRFLPPQQFRQLGDIRRDPPRLILAEQLGR